MLYCWLWLETFDAKQGQTLNESCSVMHCVLMKPSFQGVQLQYQTLKNNFKSYRKPIKTLYNLRLNPGA